MATIKPYPSFNAWSDATALRSAMNGLGTDEAAIIKILTKRTLKERLEIQQNYFKQFGRDLRTDLKSELGGKFEKLVQALLDTVPDLLARELNKAIVGLGTDDSELKGIICTLTPTEVREVRASYHNLFGIPLETAVASDVSGDYKDFLVSLLTCSRQTTVDPSSAATTAKQLYEAGEGRLGTNEEKIIHILSENSHKQLAIIFEEYEKISKKTFLQAVDDEMSGDLKKAIKTVVKSVTNLPKVYAEQLRSAMKGAGTDYSVLIRIIVWRAEKDLDLIKAEYAEHFGVGLATSIRVETSGDYEAALISMVEGN